MAVTLKAAVMRDAALGKLIELLSKDQFTTVKQISVETNCSKVQAYRRLEELKRCGFVMQTVQIRDGVSGPKATAYAITSLEPLESKNA